MASTRGRGSVTSPQGSQLPCLVWPRPSGDARCSVGQAGHAHRCPRDEGSRSQGGEICGEIQGEHRQLLHILCEQRHMDMWSRASSNY